MEKRIIVIRSLRVALVLALFCACIHLMVCKSLWFIILLAIGALLLDSTSSMVIYRIKRIEIYQNFGDLICIYSTAIIASMCFGASVMISGTVPLIGSQYAWHAIAYCSLVLVFSLIFLVMVVLARKNYKNRISEENLMKNTSGWIQSLVFLNKNFKTFDINTNIFILHVM